MRFSYWPSSEQPWGQILASVRHVEETGWDGVYFADHFMSGFGDLSAPYQECWTVLAALAAAVPRLRLGPLVTGNTYRHPAVLAKMAVTVDHVSGGRLVLGLGAGWQENEHLAYGLDFGTVKTRLDRLEEACQVIRSLLDDERASFDGAYYRLADAPMSPKPAGPLPILIGGGGEQRTMRIAARFADEWNIWGTADLLAQKGAVLDQRCEEIGRDPAEIAHSTVALLFMSDDQEWHAPYRDATLPRPAIIGTPAEVSEIVAGYVDAGVDEIIIPDFNLRSPSVRHEVLDRFIAEVAPDFV